jgi:hypothetical protein
MAAPPPAPKDEIKDRFAAAYEDEAPAPEAALDRKTEEIAAARRAAAGRFAELSGLVLHRALQQALGGKRIPGLDHIADLIGTALTHNPDIEAKIGLRGTHLITAAEQDRAAGRMVMAGQRLASGGETGSLLTAATMDGLCGRILDRVRTMLRDPQTGAEARSDAEIAFSEPFRLAAAAQAQGDAAEDRVAAALRGPRAALDRAAEDEATSRLIEGFMTSVKKGGGA